VERRVMESWIKPAVHSEDLVIWHHCTEGDCSRRHRPMVVTVVPETDPLHQLERDRASDICWRHKLADL